VIKARWAGTLKIKVIERIEKAIFQRAKKANVSILESV
jgi:hypothetical protein